MQVIVATKYLKGLRAGAIGVSLLATCSQPPAEKPDGLAGIDTRKFTAFSEVAVRKLPANVITSKFGPDGGEMSLSDIHLIVPEGMAEEQFEPSLIPAKLTQPALRAGCMRAKLLPAVIV